MITGSSGKRARACVRACARAISTKDCSCARFCASRRAETDVSKDTGEEACRRCFFLSHLITIIRAVITTISMVIKKIAIRLVSASREATDRTPAYVCLAACNRTLSSTFLRSRLSFYVYRVPSFSIELRSGFLRPRHSPSLCIQLKLN